MLRYGAATVENAENIGEMVKFDPKYYRQYKFCYYQ